MKRLAALFLLAASPAFAQQLTPSQQIASTLGSQLGICMSSAADLQTQLAAAHAEVKALKDKYEKPATPEKKD